MEKLLKDIRNCEICKEHLPDGPRPIVAAHPNSRIIIIGQAPGRAVHGSGTPWDDQSGKTLREWLGVDKEQFYDPELFAIVPMGFCYPGTVNGSDLPPRRECAPQWHPALLHAMPNVKLTLLIGQYAQRHYLKRHIKSNLTDTVRAYQEYLPEYLPLPHPSPRNNIWMSKNPWFPEEVLPELGKLFKKILN